MFHRLTSGLICSFFLIYSLWISNILNTFVLFSAVIMPLALIWFPSYFGSITGIRFGRIIGPVVTKKSSEWGVSLLGWVLLGLVLWRWFFVHDINA